ncbi:MAG: cytochrome c [Magnetococcus sp. MYC-9]
MIFYFISSFYKRKAPVDTPTGAPPHPPLERHQKEDRLPHNAARGSARPDVQNEALLALRRQPRLLQRLSAPAGAGCSTPVPPPSAVPGMVSALSVWKKTRDSQGFRITLLLLMLGAVFYVNLQDLFEWPSVREAVFAPQRGALPVARPVDTTPTSRSNLPGSRLSVVFFYKKNMKDYYCLNHPGTGCTPGQLLVSPVPDTLESIYEGGIHYAQHCVQCHGPSGKGHGTEAVRLKLPMEPLSWVGSDILDREAYLFWIVARGGGDFGGHMPPFRGILNEQQIWQVVLFLKTLR